MNPTFKEGDIVVVGHYSKHSFSKFKGDVCRVNGTVGEGHTCCLYSLTVLESSKTMPGLRIYVFEDSLQLAPDEKLLILKLCGVT